MKNFLGKLKKEEKLQIVEPSEEIKDAYIERSSETLRSAKTLFGIDNLRDSVAMTYYSMYYSLLALLFRIGVKCENHAGSIILLEKIFGINNSTISQAKKDRVDRQYYVDFSVTKEEVSNMIEVAEEFNADMLHFIDILNSEKVSMYGKKARELLQCSKKR